MLWHKIQVHLHFRFSLACKKNGDVIFPTSKILHFQWCGAYTLGLSEIFNDRVLMKQQTKLHNMAAFPLLKPYMHHLIICYHLCLPVIFDKLWNVSCQFRVIVTVLGVGSLHCEVRWRVGHR